MKNLKTLMAPPPYTTKIIFFVSHHYFVPLSLQSISIASHHPFYISLCYILFWLKSTFLVGEVYPFYSIAMCTKQVMICVINGLDLKRENCKCSTRSNTVGTTSMQMWQKDLDLLGLTQSNGHLLINLVWLWSKRWIPISRR